MPLSGGNTLAAVTDATHNADTSIGLSIAHAIITAGVPAPGQAGIGVGIALKAVNDASVIKLAGFVSAALTTATSGAEIGVVSINPARAGAGVAGLQVAGAVAGINGILATGSATGISPSLSPTAGGDANVGIKIVPLGTGKTTLRNALDTITVLGVENVSGAFFGIAAEGSVADTTGGTAITIEGVMGTFRILATAGVVPTVITNHRVLDGNSTCLLIPQRADATLTGLSAVCTANTITVVAAAVATANTDIKFIVFNKSA